MTIFEFHRIMWKMRELAKGKSMSLLLVPVDEGFQFKVTPRGVSGIVVDRMLHMSEVRQLNIPETEARIAQLTIEAIVEAQKCVARSLSLSKTS